MLFGNFKTLITLFMIDGFSRTRYLETRGFYPFICLYQDAVDIVPKYCKILHMHFYANFLSQDFSPFYVWSNTKLSEETISTLLFCLFVRLISCLKSTVNSYGHSTVSYPNHTFPWQAYI